MAQKALNCPSGTEQEALLKLARDLASMGPDAEGASGPCDGQNYSGTAFNSQQGTHQRSAAQKLAEEHTAAAVLHARAAVMVHHVVQDAHASLLAGRVAILEGIHTAAQSFERLHIGSGSDSLKLAMEEAGCALEDCERRGGFVHAVIDRLEGNLRAPLPLLAVLSPGNADGNGNANDIHSNGDFNAATLPASLSQAWQDVSTSGQTAVGSASTWLEGSAQTITALRTTLCVWSMYAKAQSLELAEDMADAADVDSEQRPAEQPDAGSSGGTATGVDLSKMQALAEQLESLAGEAAALACEAQGMVEPVEHGREGEDRGPSKEVAESGAAPDMGGDGLVQRALRAAQQVAHALSLHSTAAHAIVALLESPDTLGDDDKEQGAAAAALQSPAPAEQGEASTPQGPAASITALGHALRVAHSLKQLFKADGVAGKPHESDAQDALQAGRARPGAHVISVRAKSSSHLSAMLKPAWHLVLLQRHGLLVQGVQHQLAQVGEIGSAAAPIIDSALQAASGNMADAGGAAAATVEAAAEAGAQEADDLVDALAELPHQAVRPSMEELEALKQGFRRYQAWAAAAREAISPGLRDFVTAVDTAWAASLQVYHGIVNAVTGLAEFSTHTDAVNELASNLSAYDRMCLSGGHAVQAAEASLQRLQTYVEHYVAAAAEAGVECMAHVSPPGAIQQLLEVLAAHTTRQADDAQVVRDHMSKVVEQLSEGLKHAARAASFLDDARSESGSALEKVERLHTVSTPTVRCCHAAVHNVLAM